MKQFLCHSEEHKTNVFIFETQKKSVYTLVVIFVLKTLLAT